MSMKLSLVCIGKTDNQHLNALIQDYCQRLPHYTDFELCIIPDVKNAKNMPVEQLKEKEGKLLLTMVSEGDWMVLCDEHGKELSSVGLSKEIEKWQQSGRKRVWVVIGGAYGFSPQIYQRANQQMALSALTFSHQMVRLIVAEQLYRAFTILHGESYHHI